MYVLDASVIVKWFSEEEYTDIALKLRDDFFRGYTELVVPDLLLYEVSNALRYNPNFDETDVIEAADSLYDMGMSIIVPTGEVIRLAINLAFTNNVTIYDAFYAALAKAIDFTLITADIKFYRKTENLSFVKFIDEIDVAHSSL
ncbi:MAG: type II toxin-antitoxin system VapC family toxin [Euryarchaeota archaeon]|nr:type II toxin-antitoxin system VapC family toxin [Euryarchaeota archaeon]